MNYLIQIKRGIDYIEDHLTEDISLVDVSRAARMSHWHFQRMFKALTQETLKAYIRSRRLAQARIELLTTDRGVLEIALAAGFETQASFTRAFSKVFGMPPAKYRGLGGAQVHLEKLRIDEDYLRHLKGGVSLEPVIKELPARHMVGLSTRFYSVDSERNNIGETLPALWDDFMPRVEEVADGVEGVCYGVIRQAEPEGELLEYTAAVQVPSAPREDLPPGMDYLRVSGGRYAHFTHRGRAERVDQTVNYIYSNWLMQSGMQHSYGPDLEVYDDRWSANSEASVMEYAIPLAEAG